MGDKLKLVNVFQRNANQAEERNGKIQQARSTGRSAQKPVKPKKADSGKKKVSRGPGEIVADWWGRFRQYLREVTFELRKVVWPSRKETIGSTSVVLVVVLLCGAFLAVVDAILSRLVRLLIG